MTEASLPIELLETIVCCLISEYHSKDRDLARSKPIKFLPQWYLLPLFLVCKVWRNLVEGFLYKRISVGVSLRLVRRGDIYRTDLGVAQKLLETLTENSRLAALVEELQMGVYDGHTLDWTQTNIRIIQLCPDLKHVEIRKFHFSEEKTLAAALKEKSLVSIRFSVGFFVWEEEVRFKFYELMRQWPKLQTVDLDGIRPDVRWDRPRGLDESDPSCSYPRLQEIILRGYIDNNNMISLHTLRNMSNCITKLSFSYLAMKDDRKALEALCDCLRAWSQTLEYLKLDFQRDSLSYSPLWNALSTLERLQELQVGGLFLDFGSVASLPRLERLKFTDLMNIPEDQVDVIASYLQDLENFPVLKVILVYAGSRREMPERLRHICHQRRIRPMRWDDKLMTSLWIL